MGLAAGLFVILVIRHSKLVLLSPLAAVALFIPQIWDRLSIIFTSTYWLDSSLDGRLWSLNNGFHIWAHYPIFGSGPGTYGGKLALNYASPVYLQGIQNGYVALYFTDNQWLQLLVQTGIVGVILFALFAVNVFVELLRGYNKSNSWLSLGVAGAFVAFLVAGFFGNVLEFGAIAVPMGVMIGIAQSKEVRGLKGSHLACEQGTTQVRSRVRP
jgi:O-antigen ligase